MMNSGTDSSPIYVGMDVGRSKDLSVIDVTSLSKMAFSNQLADLAGKLKAAGYTVDQGELEEAVGFTLAKDETPAQPSGFGMPASAPYMNKEVPDNRTAAAPAAGSKEAPDNRTAAAPAAGADVLAAFAKDTGPAAKAIQELLKSPSKAAAEALLADLPTLLPDDPALAAVIAEEMAKQFSVDGRARTPAAPLENSDDQPRGKTSPVSTPGSFAPAAGGGLSDKAKAKAEKHEWQSKATQQAAEKMAVVKGGADCPDFMPGVTISGGKKFDHIAFYKEDFRHIQGHVQGDFGGGKAGYNHQAMLEGSKISHAITHGTWYAHHGDYVAVDGKDKAVVLSPDGKGLKITSAYESSDKVNEIRTGNFQRVFNKEVADDESHSTSAGA